jgi:hypothetical protein
MPAQEAAHDSRCRRWLYLSWLTLTNVGILCLVVNILLPIRTLKPRYVPLQERLKCWRTTNPNGDVQLEDEPFSETPILIRRYYGRVSIGRTAYG